MNFLGHDLELKIKYQLIILVVSIIFVTMAFKMMNQNENENENLFKELKVYYYSEHEQFSTSVFDSDIDANLALMEQLVGTLVKYGNYGRYEPYIAEQWEASNSNLTWTFKIRENLLTQDSKVIDANSFKKSLTRQLKFLNNVSNDNPFSFIKGGIRNLEENDSAGIVVSGNKLVLNFETAPIGLIQFLAQPYYGFYSNDDFKGTDWKDKRKIVSSGAYEIENWISQNNVILKKRKNWPLNRFESAILVDLRIVKTNENVNFKSSNEIIYWKNYDSNLEKTHRQIQSTPDYLFSVVLSNMKNKGFFSHESNRKIFKKKLLNLIRSEKRILKEPSFFVGKFYSNEGEPFDESSDNHFKNYEFNGENIKFGISRSTSNEIKTVFKKNISNALSPIRVDYNEFDKLDSALYSKIKDNNFYDVRIIGVNSGGGYENWGVQMMFCGKLGVSFPDPNGSICDLVESVRNGNVAESSAGELLNQIVENESYIIPIYRTGVISYFSKDINIENQSPTVSVLRFDLVTK